MSNAKVYIANGVISAWGNGRGEVKTATRYYSFDGGMFKGRSMPSVGMQVTCYFNNDRVLVGIEEG